MKLRTLALMTVFSVTAFTLSAPASAAEAPALEFTVSLSPNAGGPKISHLEAAEYKDAKAKAAWDQPINSVICPKVDSVDCTTDATHNLSGNLLVPLCQDSAMNCISNFTAVVNGKRVAAKFLEYVDSSEVAADPARGLLGTGKSQSLWQVPGALNAAGTDTYMVEASYWVDYNGKKFNFRNFAANIYPYFEVASPNQRGYSINQELVNGKNKVSFSFGPEKCAWVQEGSCGELVKFSTDVRFALTLRLQNDFSNWFNARLSNTSIAVKKVGNTANEITVEAAPLGVPIFKATISEANFPSELKAKLAAKNIRVNFPGAVGTSADHQVAMDLIEMYREYLGDATSKHSTIWSISNLQGQGRRCLDSKTEVVGLVSSNSMAYQKEPPRFEKGFIQYEVSGMHFQPDGASLQLGTYELTMKSSAARCLFGIPNVPLSATVSVVNDAGSKTASTTVVSEKNGWLTLKATGFTFSKKTIKVKITKKK